MTLQTDTPQKGSEAIWKSYKVNVIISTVIFCDLVLDQLWVTECDSVRAGSIPADVFIFEALLVVSHMPTDNVNERHEISS